MRHWCNMRVLRFFLFCFPIFFWTSLPAMGDEDVRLSLSVSTCDDELAMQGAEDGDDRSSDGCDCGLVLNLAVGGSAILMDSILHDDPSEINCLARSGGSDLINSPLHGVLACARRGDAEAAEETEEAAVHSETAAARMLDAKLTCYPLHLAALRGRPRATRALLAGGADPNQRGAHGRTPLYAAMAYELFFVRPESYGSFTTRLAEARRGACTVIKKQFSCPDLMARRPSGPPTFGDNARLVRFVDAAPQEVALPQKVPAVIRLRDWVLRPRSASLRVANRRGNIFSRQEETRQNLAFRIVQMLIEAGARQDVLDDYACTPLQLAELQHGQNSPMVKRLRLFFTSDKVFALPSVASTASPTSSTASTLPVSFSEGTPNADDGQESE